MFRFKILRKGIVTNRADFKTQEDGNAWLEKEKVNGSFGRNELLLNEKQAVEKGFDIKDAIEVIEREEGIPGPAELPIEEKLKPKATVKVPYYKFAAEYTVEIEDVTLEYQQKETKKQTIESAVSRLQNLPSGDLSAKQMSDAIKDLVLFIGVK